MRAVGVRAFRAPPELLEAPVPKPGPDEVLVRIEAAGMNPFDWKIADGVFECQRPHVFPLILGVDGVGIVEQTGERIRRFRSGDRVFGQFLHDPVGIGTYAERSTTPEGIGVTKVPAGLGAEAAAALPTAGMTALDAIDRLHPSSGDTVLIVGASGGVGSFAVALAARRGARVAAVARASSHERLRALGATLTLAPPSDGRPSGPNLPTAVAGLLDVVSDPVTFAGWARTVRRGGTAVSTIGSADPTRLDGTGVRLENLSLEPRPDLLERLAAEVVGGRIPVPLERRIPLEEAPAALAEIRAGRAVGKTVIVL